MAEFEVLIESVASVEDHPNADRLSLVGIRGYKCVSGKLEDGSHRYKVGDRVVYVPEGAVVPEWLLRKGFWSEKDNKGMLAGSKGDRVKAIRLRDALSQGILFSVDKFDGYDPEKHFSLEAYIEELNWSNIHVPGFELKKVDVGDNVAELLGITKYEPPVPASMSGEAVSIGIENTFHFDIENIKKYPNVLEGHEVVAEEKIHGTCAIFGNLPRSPYHDNLVDGEFVVASKGLFGRGISIKDTPENRVKNLYLKAFIEHGLDDVLRVLSQNFNEGRDVFVLGEIYGEGVQDLTYSDKLGFRAFGIRFRQEDGTLRWLDPDEKYELLDNCSVHRPPVLYRGPYSVEAIEAVTSGTSSIDGKTLKEGVVVTPVKEFEDRYLGRAIVKSVSPDYLLRKGGTEFT